MGDRYISAATPFLKHSGMKRGREVAGSGQMAVMNTFAVVMATTYGMLRAVAPTLHSPGEVLARVNEALSACIPPNMFVACFFTILDPRSGSLRFANAGHDLPPTRQRPSAPPNTSSKASNSLGEDSTLRLLASFAR